MVLFCSHSPLIPSVPSHHPRTAASTIQRWVLLHLHRQRFLAQQWAVRKIQAVARGYSGRETVRRLRTVQSIADELFRLTKVREREQLELAHLNADSRTLDRVNALFHATSKRTPQPLFKLLDVDVRLDNSDVFPRGWVQLYAELEAELWSQGTRPTTVAVGSTHSAVLTEEGRVYTWGWGDRGQCGHGTWTGERRPRLVEGLLSDNHPDHVKASPADRRLAARGTRSSRMKSSPSRGAGGRFGSPGVRSNHPLRSAVSSVMRVRQLVAGEEHTVALTDRGTVYSWGCGRRGQLGHGDTRAVSTPRLVEAIHRKVGAVAAGSYHTVLLIAAGSVYTCGSGRQLGLGVYAGSGDQHTPQAVPALMKRRLRSISAGGGFSMATTNDGDVYSWGSGRDGQLGHGDVRDRLVPTLVESLSTDSRHGRIVSVACGAKHAAALSSTGRVYTWGEGHYGQLGHGDTASRLKPTLVASLRLRQVQRVACAARSSHFITDYNEVVGCGCTTSVIGDAGVLARAKGTSGDSSAGGMDDAVVIDTFIQTPVVLEVPLHTVPGRSPKRLVTAFSHTMSVSGLAFTQLPNPHARRTKTGRGAGEPLIGVGGFNTVTGADSNPDVLRVLRHRSKALSTRPPVLLSGSGADGGGAGDGGLPGGDGGAASVMAAGRLPPRTPRLSLSAHKALALVPQHKLKSLTAEQLRVLTREVEAAEGRGGAHAGVAEVGTFGKQGAGGDRDGAGGGGGDGGSEGDSPKPGDGAVVLSPDPPADRRRRGRGGKPSPSDGMGPAYLLPTSASLARSRNHAADMSAARAGLLSSSPSSPSFGTPPPRSGASTSFDAGAGAGAGVGAGVGAGGAGDDAATVDSGVGAASIASPRVADAGLLTGTPLSVSLSASNPRNSHPRKSAEVKAKQLEAAAQRRQEEEHRRQAWRQARERRGKGADGVDIAGLFSPALLVATSNDDMEVADVLATYSSGRSSANGAAPASWSFAAHQADTATPRVNTGARGLTVRSMLTSGTSNDSSRPPVASYAAGGPPAFTGSPDSARPLPAGTPAAPKTAMMTAASALGLGVSPLQSTLAPPAVDGAAARRPRGVPPPPPPQPGAAAASGGGTGVPVASSVPTSAFDGGDESLEAVLSSIKQRAAAQVAALWGNLDD